MAASPSVPTAAPPGLEAVLPLFEAHGAMWSQYFAMQAALLAPWAEWQCAWWRACGLPADALPLWNGAPVGGDPLP